jgi:3-oxoacyl-[acyl-carrier-protein] synthase II
MHRVAITGLGLVSSQGQNIDAVFDQWSQGIGGIAQHSIGEAPYSVDVAMAACSNFDATISLGRAKVATMERVSHLSMAAAAAAWTDSNLDCLSTLERETIGVFWGTSAGGVHTTEKNYRDLLVKQKSRISPLCVIQGMINSAASHIALRYGFESDCISYAVACASSAIAIGEAFHRIKSGRNQVMMTGGAEASMPFGLIKAWESLQVLAPIGENAATSCRPFHAQRKGLVLGEGAAALVLENWDHAHARGAKIYAELIGYGASCDHSHITTPNLNGQLRALRATLKDAGVNAHEVGYVNTHGTATAEGDPVEVAALKELLGEHAQKVMVSATKSLHGHWLGGGGAIETLITALSLHKQTVLPTANLDLIDPHCLGVDHVTHSARMTTHLNVALTSSFAFGGSNSVLALRRCA